MMELAAALILILHGIDGREIRVSPSQVTSMHAPKPGAKEKDRLYPAEANCLINLTDGKSVVVVETCTHVEELIK